MQAQAVYPNATQLTSRSTRPLTLMVLVLSPCFGHGVLCSPQWPGSSLLSFVSLSFSLSHCLSLSLSSELRLLSCCLLCREKGSASSTAFFLSFPPSPRTCSPSAEAYTHRPLNPAVLQALQEKTALFPSFLQPLSLHPSAPSLSQTFFADP